MGKRRYLLPTSSVVETTPRDRLVEVPGFLGHASTNDSLRRLVKCWFNIDRAMVVRFVELLYSGDQFYLSSLQDRFDNNKSLTVLSQELDATLRYDCRNLSAHYLGGKQIAHNWGQFTELSAILLGRATEYTSDRRGKIESVIDLWSQEEEIITNLVLQTQREGALTTEDQEGIKRRWTQLQELLNVCRKHFAVSGPRLKWFVSNPTQISS